jgi:hypothetical protein
VSLPFGRTLMPDHLSGPLRDKGVALGFDHILVLLLSLFEIGLRLAKNLTIGTLHFLGEVI